MEQRLSVITLGVEDLERSKDFYQNTLGWKVAQKSQEEIVLFQIGGMVLALYPKADLAQDACLPLGAGFGGITLAYNAKSKQEVDQILEQVQKEGGHILKAAQDVFWGGYSGYFQDPDGYPFEVAWNPFWPLDDQGNIDVS